VIVAEPTIKMPDEVVAEAIDAETQDEETGA
jgi:hypothetical protein